MSDRVSPRAPREGKRIPVSFCAWDDMPDPPDNPEFLLLSPEKQEQIAERFRLGILLGQSQDLKAARLVYQARKDLGRRIRSKPLTAPLDKIARGRKVRA